MHDHQEGGNAHNHMAGANATVLRRALALHHAAPERCVPSPSLPTILVAEAMVTPSPPACEDLTASDAAND